MSQYQNKIDSFIEELMIKDGHEPEFIQAVEEVVETIIPFIENNSKYHNTKILERIVEPEIVIQFRVPWVDDSCCNELFMVLLLITFKPIT